MASGASRGLVRPASRTSQRHDQSNAAPTAPVRFKVAAPPPSTSRYPPAGTTSRRRPARPTLRGCSDAPLQGPPARRPFTGTFSPASPGLVERHRMTTAGPEPPLLPVRALVLVLRWSPVWVPFPDLQITQAGCARPAEQGARDERPVVEERHAASEASFSAWRPSAAHGRTWPLRAAAPARSRGRLGRSAAARHAAGALR